METIEMAVAINTWCAMLEGSFQCFGAHIGFTTKAFCEQAKPSMFQGLLNHAREVHNVTPLFTFVDCFTVFEKDA